MTRRSTDACALFSALERASSLACTIVSGICLAVARTISIVSSGSRPNSPACAIHTRGRIRVSPCCRAISDRQGLVNVRQSSRARYVVERRDGHVRRCTDLRVQEAQVFAMQVGMADEPCRDEDLRQAGVLGIQIPFPATVPITVENGMLDGGASGVEISAGSVESASVSVISTTGTTGTVTVDIGTLRGLPTDHGGYVLQKSGTLPLEVLPQTMAPSWSVAADPETIA